MAKITAAERHIIKTYEDNNSYGLTHHARGVLVQLAVRLSKSERRNRKSKTIRKR